MEILGDKTPKGQAHPHFHILLVVKESYFKSRDYLKKDDWDASTASTAAIQAEPSFIKPPLILT